jgi:hypothetical protein
MLIGKLIYLIVTRPDMSLVVSHISNFMYSPRTPYLDVVNKILRYLKGTPGKKIWMKKNDINAICNYSDADWAPDKNLDEKNNTKVRARGRALVDLET